VQQFESASNNRFACKKAELRKRTRKINLFSSFRILDTYRNVRTFKGAKLILNLTFSVKLGTTIKHHVP